MNDKRNSKRMEESAEQRINHSSVLKGSARVIHGAGCVLVDIQQAISPCSAVSHHKLEPGKAWERDKSMCVVSASVLESTPPCVLVCFS